MTDKGDTVTVSNEEWLAQIATDKMKEAVEKTLAPLVGLPLSKMYRHKGVQFFEFGVQLPCLNAGGMPTTRGQYAILMDCGWRIISAQGVVVGANDYYWTAKGKEERNEFGEENGSLRDRRAARFFSLLDTESLEVLRVEADRIGSVRLHMTQDYSIDILILDSLAEEDQWKLIPLSGAKPVVVISGEGVKLSP